MKASKSEIFKFSLVMIIFLVGAIALMINKIYNPILWVVYISIWTWTELKIAKNIHLKWWVWVLIIGGISVIDIAIINAI